MPKHDPWSLDATKLRPVRVYTAAEVAHTHAQKARRTLKNSPEADLHRKAIKHLRKAEQLLVQSGRY